MTAPLRTPALLQTATEVETPYGGRDRTWTDVAILWIALSPGPPSEVRDGSTSPPVGAASAVAVAREHPSAAAGARLLVDDDPDPWRVVRVDREAPGPGRMTLRLDRIL
ncbi:hypothetical protein BH09PSE2_BH09PSE2_03440 [soil metagenome]